MVVVRNKELLIFPIFISAATAVIFLFFFAPAALWPTGFSYLSGDHWHALADKYFRSYGTERNPHFSLSPIAGVYVAFLYFVSMFTATFFNVAFYNEILAALSGEPVSLGRGLRFACTRWKAILMWALFAGLIGLIIKAIEQKFEIVGRIIARFVGLAWSIASVFVIPVIVREESSSNPIAMIKKSAGILQQVWGEGLIGYVGIGAINSIVFVSSLAVVVVASIASAQLHLYWVLGFAIAGWLLSMILWSYLMNVASLVYKGALFLYASEGIVSEPYDQDMLNSAWKYKK
jgi:hypothetical protein